MHLQQFVIFDLPTYSFSLYISISNPYVFFIFLTLPPDFVHMKNARGQVKYAHVYIFVCWRHVF
jgi:threonine/homoserine/homoserine lactone efflux protein